MSAGEKQMGNSNSAHTPGPMSWAEIIAKQSTLIQKTRIHGGDWVAEADCLAAMKMAAGAAYRAERAAIAAATGSAQS